MPRTGIALLKDGVTDPAWYARWNGQIAKRARSFTTIVRATLLRWGQALGGGRRAFLASALTSSGPMDRKKTQSNQATFATARQQMVVYLTSPPAHLDRAAHRADLEADLYYQRLGARLLDWASRKACCCHGALPMPVA